MVASDLPTRVSSSSPPSNQALQQRLEGAAAAEARCGAAEGEAERLRGQLAAARADAEAAPGGSLRGLASGLYRKQINSRTASEQGRAPQDPS